VVNKINKNIVAGLGEIGIPILKLLSSSSISIGYDINPKLMNKKLFNKYEKDETLFLHICIPFSLNFLNQVISLNDKFKPKIIVIHSTISPHTTESLQKKIDVPIIYSATRGVHKRMLSDLRKYTKFFAISKNSPKPKWASSKFKELMKRCGVKTKQMSDPVTLELAKIVVDTSYYGWLINYAQISNMIAKKHGVNYDEMWTFSDEIHKYLGDRPKMFPGFIGGHCVIPNLSLIKENELDKIKKINEIYLDKIPDAKKIARKYVKGKQSYEK
jgi:UDP-N-acetyl-D-mannosaminuronate dehydrogenase